VGRTTAPYMHDGRATTLTEAILERRRRCRDSRRLPRAGDRCAAGPDRVPRQPGAVQGARL